MEFYYYRNTVSLCKWSRTIFGFVRLHSATDMNIFRWTTIINDELQAVEEQKRQVQAALCDLTEICNQLEIEMPKQPSCLNLQQQLEWVETSSAKVEAIRAKREALYFDLRKNEKELLARMTDGVVWKMPRSLTSRGVLRTLPNDDDLRELTSHVKMIREERQIRLEKLRPLVEASCMLMERMGKVPRLPIEEDLSNLPADHWNLTQENIKRAAEARDAVSILLGFCGGSVVKIVCPRMCISL